MELKRIFVGATVGMVLACPLALADEELSSKGKSNKQQAQQAAGGMLQAASDPSTLTVSGTTVSGESRWYRMSYDAGETPDISSGRDDQGGQLPDGQYNYEIRSVAADADADASPGNGNQLGRAKRQQPVLGWGRFEVVGGTVVAN